MDLLARIAQVIIPVFFIIGVGFAYARRVRPDLGVLNRIVLDVLTPALVYTALADKDFHLRDQTLLLAGGAALILASGLVGWWVAHLSQTQARTLVPVVMFNNCGNMGLPLALLAFGPQHFGAAVALFSISNLFHFSVGARITSAHARTRDLLLSPVMVAAALGFASAATGLLPPGPLFTGLKIMGEAMLPLMLFALGARLTALRRQDAPQGMLGACARPLIGLALALPLVWVLGLQGAAKGQLILFGVLPPAVLQFMFAERYGQEPEKVAAMVLLGNALSLLFIPLGLALSL